MNKTFAAVAAALLALVLLAPAAEARCWWNGYRWHCTHYYHHYVGYPYSYPYYGYGYHPYYYRPYYRPYYGW